jgi:tRNA threonylcarbamoyladenosine biosynthesis protein TsaB
MRVLALDTTTAAGSLALLDGDRLVEERTGDATRTHGVRLPGELLALLDAHRLAVGDVDLFAVAAGPGSFTGLRIGIATIQGLAFATRRRVVAVSALEALAQIASREAGPGGEDETIGALVDAHRGEVFGALYRSTAAAPFSPERLIALDGPTVDRAANLLARWTEQGCPPAWLVGDGIAAHADEVRRASQAQVAAAPMLAAAIGRMAAVAAARGQTIPPGAVQPLYVRRPDAELARDRRG